MRIDTDYLRSLKSIKETIKYNLGGHAQFLDPYEVCNNSTVIKKKYIIIKENRKSFLFILSKS